MLEYLKALDRELFIKLNSLHSPFWDNIMVAVSDKFFWIPFYMLLLAFLIYQLRKKSYILIIAIAIAITAADRITSGIIKPLAARLRPCHDASLINLMNTVDRCGGKYGFVSSHAANSFALAILISLILGKKFNYFKIFLFVWAIVISYSRVYLGVHYPGDILAGAFIGLLIGYICAQLFRYLIKKYFIPAADKPI